MNEWILKYKHNDMIEPEVIMKNRNLWTDKFIRDCNEN